MAHTSLSSRADTTLEYWNQKRIDSFFKQQPSWWNKIEKIAWQFGSTTPLFLHTSGNESSSGHERAGQLADGIDQAYQKFYLDPMTMVTRVTMYEEDELLVKPEAAVVEYRADNVERAMLDHLRYLDTQAHLSTGYCCLGRISTATSATATQTLDISSTAANSGWSGTKYLRANMPVIILNALGALMGTYRTISSVAHSSNQITLSSAVDTTTGGPYYIFKANPNHYGSANNGTPAGYSNDYAKGVTGFRLIASANNGAMINSIANRHGGKFENVTRSASTDWANGIQLTATNFGGSAGTVIAPTEAGILNLATKGARMLMDYTNLYAELRMNMEVRLSIWKALQKGAYNFQNQLPDKMGMEDTVVAMGGMGTLKMVLDPLVPDNEIFAPNYSHFKFYYALKPGWRPGHDKLIPEQSYLKESGTIMTIGDFGSDFPAANGWQTDVLQDYYAKS